MKTVLLLLCLVLPSFAVSLAAKEAPEKNKSGKKLTLEDVIFDADYLKKALGAKTLVVPDEKTGLIPTEAIAKAGFAEKTQVYVLPDDAVRPVLKDSVAPSLNQSFRMKREPSKAEFFVFIGNDGKVKSLHCYNTNDQVYAIIAADALIKWTYTPAKLGSTAVPVILPVEMKFDESDAAIGTFRAGKPPISVQGNPSSPAPVRPNPGGNMPR